MTSQKNADQRGDGQGVQGCVSSVHQLGSLDDERLVRHLLIKPEIVESRRDRDQPEGRNRE